jgi:hypothetical protein
MKLVFFTCLLFGLLLSGISHAEGNCPEGYYPIGGSGAEGCAQVPGYNQQQGRQYQQQEQQEPSPQWANRWGAIATDSIKGILGVATHLASESEADDDSLADCRLKGGTQCKLQSSYINSCIALITGDKIFNVSLNPDLDQAVQLGIAQCSADDTNCHVYYSACSLPVRTH